MVDERQVLAAQHVCTGVFVTVIYYKIEINKNKKDRLNEFSRTHKLVFFF